MGKLIRKSICDTLMAWRIANSSLDDDMCILAAHFGLIYLGKFGVRIPTRDGQHSDHLN